MSSGKPLARRRFLKTMVAAGAVPSLFSLAKPPALVEWSEGPYGPLVQDPKGLLDLPKGFSYHLFSKTGETMDDGFLVPSALDGMAAFPGDSGTTILVRNHELSPNDNRTTPYGKDKDKWAALGTSLLYDEGRSGVAVCGGTSTLVYDTRQRKLLKHHLSLAGTFRNCAGGRTPWHTWISCEETTQYALGSRDTNHGYCFEVDPRANQLQPPRRLPGLGRFRHEAVAIDPRDGIVYLTEDLNNGLFYRFIPETPNNLAGAGRLQALSIIEMSGESTANRKDLGPATVEANKQMAVRWIDLDQTNNPLNDLHLRGQQAGASTFCRGEGIDFGGDTLVFSCTSGGPVEQGQVWRYTPGKNSGKANETPGMLELFAEPNDSKRMSMVDNLVISPNGDIILAEDNTKNHNRIIGITPKGQIYTLAKNVRTKHEFAGCTWSPDGQTLFFNIFDEGGTVAVTGPWRNPA